MTVGYLVVILPEEEFFRGRALGHQNEMVDKFTGPMFLMMNADCLIAKSMRNGSQRIVKDRRGDVRDKHGFDLISDPNNVVMTVKHSSQHIYEFEISAFNVNTLFKLNFRVERFKSDAISGRLMQINSLSKYIKITKRI